MAAKFHTRSVSLPSRSHPTTVKIDEELSKLRSLDAASTSGSTSSIFAALAGLERVYDCLDELLNMPSTQQALARGLNGKCLDELMDGSVRLLDTCEASKDAMSRLREEVAALQSAIRRRRMKKGSSVSESSVFESSVLNYVSLRKRTRKDAKKLAAGLKHMENIKLVNQVADDQDDHFSAIIRVIREVNLMSSFVLQSLLGFVSAPVNNAKQSSKWGVVCKLMKGSSASSAAVGCVESVSEIRSADAAAFSIAGEDDEERKQFVQKELGCVEGRFGEVEKSLESVFRRMIKSRSSLLNILSH